jgi:hypothetical protein
MDAASSFVFTPPFFFVEEEFKHPTNMTSPLVPLDLHS